MFRSLNVLLLATVTAACANQPVERKPTGRDNSVPALAGALIAEGDYRKEDVITVTPQGWSDADGDPEWYRYQWYVDGVPVAGQTFASLSGEYFGKGSEVYCQVTPVDAFAAGLPVNSNAVTIGNTPPALRAAALSVDVPTSGDDLTLVPIDSFDPDGEPIVYSVAWYVNGTQVMEVTELTLPREHYVRGDSVYAVVTPYDGETPGTSFSTEPVVIRNALPKITMAALSPGPHDRRNPIGALVDAEDADGDLLTYAFRWYVNGVSIPYVTGTVLAASWFERGDTVFFETRAHDGFGFGAWVGSERTVIQNAPPVAPTAALYPSHVSTSDPVWVVASANGDPDGDPVILRYAWYKNGELQPFPSSTTAVISNPVTYYTRPDDEWRAVVFASDGTADSEVFSEPVIVQKVRFREVSGYSYYNSHWDDTSYFSSLSCAIDTRDALWCWGGRRLVAPYPSSPYAISGTTPKRFGGSWRTLGTHAQCGIRSDGTLWCWPHYEEPGGHPEQVGNATDWIAVYERPWDAYSPPSTCAQNSSGELWCWGVNNDYSLGLGTSEFITAPTLVTAATAWQSVSLSDGHGCGSTADGKLWCWGFGDSGELGVGISNCALAPDPACYRPYPTVVTELTGWVDVATARWSSCGVRDDGTLWCWGRTDSYTGPSLYAGSYFVYPTQVGTDTDWDSIEGSWGNYCGRKESGQVFCWGSDESGQLGVGGNALYDVCDPGRPCFRAPLDPVNAIEDFTTVSVHSHQSCGIRQDGTLWCWGSNQWGELGIGIPLGTGKPDDRVTGPEQCEFMGHACSTVPREVFQ